MKKKIFFQGFVYGAGGLTVFYYALLFLFTRDFSYPVSQFARFQPWMSLLIIGFGIQWGLFLFMKKGFRFSVKEQSEARTITGTGTAVSGISMVACCAHHAVEFLPFLGVSAAAVFFSEYQAELLMIGVVTNAAGILFMVRMLYPKVSV